MCVYVDVSSSVHSKAGIGRYAGSLAAALSDRLGDRLRLFYNRGGDTLPPAGLERVARRTVRAGYKPWRMAVWLGHLAGLGFDRLVPDAELFHATEHLLPPLHQASTVLTVHDMIFKLFPEHQKPLNYRYLTATMPLYCRRATAIITVSHASKHDIVTHYRIDPGKVTVVHEAASAAFSVRPAGEVEDARRRYRLPERYLLHVGTIEPRKNLARLVEALHALRSDGLEIPLVVVGTRGWLYAAFFQRIEELGLGQSVLFPGYVADADLPLLYGAATVVAVPSVYEGFGLPLLEAMSCGTPVVSSNASSLPEVGGAAARYFVPTDVEGMATAIREVWTDAELQEEMRTAGLAHAARFSWERAARETIAVYERASGGLLSSQPTGRRSGTADPRAVPVQH